MKYSIDKQDQRLKLPGAYEACLIQKGIPCWVNPTQQMNKDRSYSRSTII